MFNKTGLSRMKLEELQAEYERNLNEKRKRLAELLENERLEYEKEFRESYETPDQRRERMKQRAKELKDAREQKRREVAAMCLKQRARLAQDEMRLEQSRLRTRKVAQDRFKQIEEKEEIANQREEEEKQFAREWDRDRIRKGEREGKEREESLKRNHQMKTMLDAQVHDSLQIKQLEMEQLENERTQLRKQWQQEEEEEKQRNLYRLEEQRLARKAVQQENIIRAQIREREKTTERQMDKYLLQQQMAKDQEAEAQLRARQLEAKKAEKIFQEHLREMAIKEKIDESKLEKIRADEQEKEWRKREEKWKKEADERLALWNEVDRARKLQIEEKKRLQQIEREENAQWIQEKQRNDLQELNHEREKILQEQKIRKHSQELLKAQIAEKERQRAIERQNELLLEKRAARYHEEFEQQIKALREEAKQSDILDRFPKKTLKYTH